MNRRILAMAAIALATLLGTSGCDGSPGSARAAPESSPNSSFDPALITVELTPKEREACYHTEMVERIEIAKYGTGESPEESIETGILVTPQTLLEGSRSWPKAVAQKKKWDALAPEDRLFNLCMMEPVRTWGAFDESDCVVVPATVLAAIDKIMLDEANSLPSAHAFFDRESQLWLIMGEFAGPASQGEGLLGAWGTPADIASDPFVGEFWALDGGAQQFTSAPISDTNSFDVRPLKFPASSECNGVLEEGFGK